MNEPDISKRSADTSKMLDYGFNVYMVRNIIDDSSVIDKVKVELGKKTEAEIIANDKITVLSKKSEEKRNITYKANIDKIVAPVKKGDKVGTIDIIEDNKIIGTVEATVKEDIAKALEELGVGAGIRGETLTLEQFARLSNILKKYM